MRRGRSQLRCSYLPLKLLATRCWLLAELFLSTDLTEVARKSEREIIARSRRKQNGRWRPEPNESLAFSQELPACSQQLRRKPARFRPLSKPGLRLWNGGRLGELASGERGFHRLRQCLAIAKGREHRECLRVDSLEIYREIAAVHHDEQGLWFHAAHGLQARTLARLGKGVAGVVAGIIAFLADLQKQIVNRINQIEQAKMRLQTKDGIHAQLLHGIERQWRIVGGVKRFGVRPFQANHV